MERIYLDYAAATPLDKQVLEDMLPYLTAQYGNPSSLHYFGQQARAAVQRSREIVAKALAVKIQDIVFTAGGTEADNLAILGYLRANFPKGGHIITTAIEHHAVLRTFEWLATQGYEVTFLPVQADGRVDIQTVRAACQKNTVLISVMAVNNETGMIQPIKQIGMLAHELGIAFHVDAVQAFGYINIQPKHMHIDLLTICGHKIYGPKGIGVLYIRPGIQVHANSFGGPQEHRLHAGTENVPAIVGLGSAVKLVEAHRQEWSEHVFRLKKRIFQEFIVSTKNVRYNGTLENSAPHIMNFSMAECDSAVLLIRLDRAGIAVSAGSACEAGAAQASHVLQAMGISSKWLKGSLRISLGKETTETEVDRFITVMKDIAAVFDKGARI